MTEDEAIETLIGPPREVLIRRLFSARIREVQSAIDEDRIVNANYEIMGPSLKSYSFLFRTDRK
jgi:hypothetical protein